MIDVSEVVILAGGRADKLGQDAPCKGLAVVNGKTLLELTIEGFLKDKRFKKIVVTAPVDVKLVGSTENSVLNDSKVSCAVTDSSVIDNLIRGIDETEGEYILVSTADIPFIGPEAVEGMIKVCSGMSADFFYPIIPKDVVVSKFPSFTKTYMKTADGIFSGGNLFLIKRDTARNNKKFLDELFVIRKSPFKLVGKLGVIFVLKFITKRIKIKEMEDKVSKLMNCRGRAVIVNFPEIGIDIDDADDLNMLKGYVK